MSALQDWNWTHDGWVLLAALLCAVASALLGNFLVLRRMSLLGDAISHAVLPGLAVAFFLTGTRNSVAMFIGAVIVGVLTAFFTEWIRGVGQVDEGASMGVVFTSLFALGLVMIVQAADHVDLDPGCVLYGALEYTYIDLVPIFGFSVPRAVVTLGIVTLLNGLFVYCFYKELKVSSFDPALATTLGYSAGLMHYLLMVLVAVTAVASFESVGNILVVAMLVVPAAAAYMLTDRLNWMIGLSVVLAACSAVLGHLSAIVVPAWFGSGNTHIAGMMAVSAGLILFLAAAFGPQHGFVVKMVRRWLLSWKILADDVIALLYRIEERGAVTKANCENLERILLSSRFSLQLVLNWLLWKKEIALAAGTYHLAERGQTRAHQLVRSHRLWEQYLSTHAGIETDRIHDKAEQFEHFTDGQLRKELDEATNTPAHDPHGRKIPFE